MQITAAMVKELREATSAGMAACKNALVEAAGDIKRATEILREKGLAAAAKKAGRVAAEGVVMAAVTPDRKKGVLIEVNSETDFVAKNEEFLTFVENMAKQVLASTAATPDAIMDEKWIADASQTVKDVLTSKISTIGENIGLRRFERFEAADGAVVEYIHHDKRVGTMITITGADDTALEAGRNVCMQIALMAPKYITRADVPEDYIAEEKAFLLQQATTENDASDKPKPANIIENMVNGRLSKSLKEVCLMDQEYVKDGQYTIATYLKAANPSLNVTAMARYEKGEGIEKEVKDFATEVAEAMNA